MTDPVAHGLAALLELARLSPPGEATLLKIMKGEPRQTPILAAAWRDEHWARRLGGRFTQGYRLYREGNEVLILGEQSGAELYDLSQDPGMLLDLAESRPERVMALMGQADGAWPEVEVESGLPLTPEQEAALRAMGYVE